MKPGGGSSGCSCRAAGDSRAPDWAWTGLALLTFGCVARRRRFGARRHSERRRFRHRLIKPLRCRGSPLEIDVLALRTPEPFAHAIEQLRAAGAEVAEDDGNARWAGIEGSVNAPFECGSGRRWRFVCGHR